MSKEAQSLIWKLVGTLLTLMVTGLCYFVWDLNAWKSSLDAREPVSALKFQEHLGHEELMNQKIVLYLKLQGIEIKEN